MELLTNFMPRVSFNTLSRHQKTRGMSDFYLLVLGIIYAFYLSRINSFMTESLSLDWFLYDNGLCHEIVKMTLVTSILFFRAENKIHTFEMRVASSSYWYFKTKCIVLFRTTKHVNAYLFFNSANFLLVCCWFSAVFM